jgi:hypothetical protein
MSFVEEGEFGSSKPTFLLEGGSYIRVVYPCLLDENDGFKIKNKRKRVT